MNGSAKATRPNISARIPRPLPPLSTGTATCGRAGAGPLNRPDRSWFAQPATVAPPAAPGPAALPTPMFRFECPGCPQGAEAVCHHIVYRAIANAIKLCVDTANKLDATPRSTDTRRIFTRCFATTPLARFHRPAQRVPARLSPSVPQHGTSVAFTGRPHPLRRFSGQPRQ